MSGKNVDQLPVGDEKETKESPKLSTAEERAAANGWKPEADYDGDDWVSAEVFNVRGDMIGQINKTKKEADALRNEMSKTKAQLAEIEALNERILKADIAKEKARLKAEKIKAQEVGDYEKAEDLNDEIKTVEEKFENESSSTQATKEATSNKPPQEIVQWYETHGDTMASNDEFKELADSYALLYAKQAGKEGYDPVEAVEFVDKRLKKMFPEEYGVKRKAPPTVENEDIDGGDGKKPRDPKTSKYTLNHCNEQEKRVAIRMADQLEITPDEYVKRMAKDQLLEVQHRSI